MEGIGFPGRIEDKRGQVSGIRGEDKN